MTLCIVHGKSCECQPDEGVFCPYRTADWYEECLQRAIHAGIVERDQMQRVIEAAKAMRHYFPHIPTQDYRHGDITAAFDASLAALEMGSRQECRNPDACAFPKCTCPPTALEGDQ